MNDDMISRMQALTRDHRVTHNIKQQRTGTRNSVPALKDMADGQRLDVMVGNTLRTYTKAKNRLWYISWTEA